MFRALISTLALASLLAGCGGGGGVSGVSGGSYGAVSSNSPHAGSWAGHWWDYNNPRDELRVTVRTDGTFTGEIEDPFIPTAAPVNGSIRDDGTVQASYQFPDRDRVTVTGTLAARYGNELGGVLRARSSGGSRDIDVVIARQ